MAEIKYDVKRGADIYRAIYESRLQGWISTGKIKQGEVIVWRGGLSGWRRPEELDELKPFFEKWERLRLRRVKRRKPEKQIMLRKKVIKDILIVDNEKDICLLLSEALSDRKYNVAIANTKKDALSSIRRKIPDLVFLDLKLSDGDGMKVLSKIKKKNPKTTVNIISAYGSDERKEEAKNKGAYVFIDKPFTEKEILRSIK
ncbi:response regulator [Patescibacteria group bacterium]|nr:response regulator [Patescibacteria group bacterium]